MFGLCGDSKPSSKKYAIQMFQSPEQSQLDNQNQHKLKAAYIRANDAIQNSRVINIIDNQSEPDLNKIIKFLLGKQFKEVVLKKVLKSDYDILVQSYQKTNKMWTDLDFPPEQRSFGVGRNVEKIVWKRIGQIIKNPVFIGSSLNSSDILQGRIGNCYFLSAIAGLAERDFRIKSIFPNLTMNRNGIYMARILHKGVLQEVIVDDYFPVSKRDNKLMCSQPTSQNQIWVLILEKCWAKLYGSYTSIDGGLPNEVLHAFSGAPVYQYLTNQFTGEESQSLFQKLLQSVRLGHVICCGTNSDTDCEEIGLVQAHAYTILEVFDKPRKLIKVRNPWGDTEWMGNGSDQDKQFWNRVSNLDKKRLGYQQKNDGVFFMFWEDFLKYFLIINICKVDDRANYYFEELTYTKDTPLYTKLITKGGNVAIAITQENTRGINIPFPRYATATAIIAKKVVQNGVEDYQYTASFTQRNVCDANMQLNDLAEGQYVIYSLLSGRNGQQDATLSCYCQKPVQITLNNKINSEQFIYRVFLDHARKNKESQQKIFGNMDVWVCMDILYQSGFGYTVVHVGSKAKIKLGLTFLEQQYSQNNFELLPPYRGSGLFKIVCQSGQDSIVICKIIPKSYAVEASMPIPSIKRLM